MGLRRRLANAVAAAVVDRPVRHRLRWDRAEVKTGLEVERDAGWPSLRGKRVGVIVNPTAIDRRRVHLLTLLDKAEGVEMVRLFAPEHGLRAALDETFEDGTDEVTGLPVVSLYGQRRAPEPQHLEDLDALVFDIQDAGERFYTYTATMCLAMKAAAEAGVEFVVLDRPNLLRLDLVAGPLLDEPFANLAEYHPLPMAHGLTSGELARYANEEYPIGVELTVAPCEGYRRDLWFDQTGLPWVNASPNLRTMKAAILYPALGMLERCNMSVGRGTDAPFEYFGAPWMDGDLVARRLESSGVAGLAFVPVEFTPTEREFAGERCSGCYVMLLDREAFEPVRAGLEIARALVALYGEQVGAEKIAGLLGSRRAVEMLLAGEEVEPICALWQQELEEYLQRREKYLLY
ncbi:MAG: DUF1343 domain-containing protein, partial [Armatimonadetes bacterium]|nr:DUF1343 domain-containing protein [Armatimonadota bacterium]